VPGPPPPAPTCPEDLYGPPPGWLFALEADITRPAARIATGPDRGSGVDLDWTVAPRITLGYRFENAGSLLVSYRYLFSDTGLDLSSSGGPVASYSLEENWIDVTYLTRPWGPSWCGLRVQLEAGVRTAVLHDHGHGETDVEIDDGTDTFAGVGPELGLHLSWTFGDSGVALFGRSSVGVLFGRTRERTDQFINDGVDQPTLTTTTDSHAQTVWDWRGEAGLSWTVPHRPWMRFDLGVEGEVFRWQGVNYSDVGPFFRFLYSF
jgi:hypothetical protein